MWSRCGRRGSGARGGARIPRTAVPSLEAPQSVSTRDVHDVTRSYLLGCGDELATDDANLAATVSTQVIAHFTPSIALVDNTNEEEERFIAEIARMLSLWI